MESEKKVELDIIQSYYDECHFSERDFWRMEEEESEVESFVRGESVGYQWLVAIAKKKWTWLLKTSWEFKSSMGSVTS